MAVEKKKTSKKPRKTKTSYRMVDGKKVKMSPHGAGGKVKLTVLQKALMTPYLDQEAARMRRRTEGWVV